VKVCVSFDMPPANSQAASPVALELNGLTTLDRGA